MPDMLVKLYDLPDLHEPLCRTKGIGIETRRPNPWEKSILLKTVGATLIEGSSPGIYDSGLTRKAHAPDSRT